MNSMTWLTYIFSVMEVKSRMSEKRIVIDLQTASPNSTDSTPLGAISSCI